MATKECVMRSGPLALQTTFSDPGNVKEIESDPDAFDSLDCSIYAVDEADDDPMHMIEHSLGETCDCGNRVFSFNRCTNCGAQAPWASKLGCGTA
jgi:hypothetical protein